MLTTIRTHMEAMGKTAAAEIIRLLSGEHGRIERIPGSMVVRRSCTLRG